MQIELNQEQLDLIIVALVLSQAMVSSELMSKKYQEVRLFLQQEQNKEIECPTQKNHK